MKKNLPREISLCVYTFSIFVAVLYFCAYQAEYWCVWMLWLGSQTGRWAGPAGKERGTHRKRGYSDRSAPEPEQIRTGWLWNASAGGLECTEGSSLTPGGGKGEKRNKKRI